MIKIGIYHTYQCYWNVQQILVGPITSLSKDGHDPVYNALQDNLGTSFIQFVHVHGYSLSIFL